MFGLIMLGQYFPKMHIHFYTINKGRITLKLVNLNAHNAFCFMNDIYIYIYIHSEMLRSKITISMLRDQDAGVA